MQDSSILNKVSVTGDRPTGPLHLGHYIGSLVNRLSLQDQCSRQFIILADLQAMVNDRMNGALLRKNTVEVMKDYLSTGLDPKKNIFLLQSKITPLHEITAYYNTLITLSHLHNNPTIRQELRDKEVYTSNDKNHSCDEGKNQITNDNNDNLSINMHFLLHPVSQAADITAFAADVVPVGNDQLPIIHLTNDIVDKFNNKFGNTLQNIQPIISHTPRLLGIDGKAKASKSLNNAIFLSDSSDIVKQKVNKMYTDPNHIQVSQPGQVEGNIVFEYLTAFHKDQIYINELKEQYRRGGLGDIFLKNLLYATLEELLEPIRYKRSIITDAHVDEILNQGTQVAHNIAQNTLDKIKHSMNL